MTTATLTATDTTTFEADDLDLLDSEELESLKQAAYRAYRAADRHLAGLTTDHPDFAERWATRRAASRLYFRCDDALDARGA